MSYWTHITACFSVDTYKELNRPEMRKYVKDILKKAPKITGSEGDTEVFINIPKGYSISSWGPDCNRCEYGASHKFFKKDGTVYEECDAPGNNCIHANEWAHYQSCVVISLQGDLRDRQSAHTQKEFDKFKKYIEKHFWIRDYSVNIEGE